MSNEEFREQLSAFVDDELRAEERGFLLRRVSQSVEAREQLERYYLVSDTLRGHLSGVGRLDLTARIAAALQDEPTLSAPSVPFTKRLMRPATGLAVAASVAALSMTFWTNQPQLPVAGQDGSQSLAGAAPMLAPVSDAPAQHWDRLDPEVQKRLNGYLVNHSEYSASRQVGGVLTYVRIAGQRDAE